jgi:two-component sensor histidine kinase
MLSFARNVHTSPLPIDEQARRVDNRRARQGDWFYGSSMIANEPATASQQLPYRVVLASIVGVWLCYFVLSTARGAIVGLELQDELLWRRAAVTVMGVAITAVMWVVLRAFDNRVLWVKITAALLTALPASLMVAQANQWMFAPIEARVTEIMGQKRGVALRTDEAGNLFVDVPARQTEGVERAAGATPATSVIIAPAPSAADRWRQLVDVAIGRYFLLVAWAALYLALLTGAQARAAERRAGEYAQAANAAELRSLRYQVNPHFLFNTLNSLSALVMTGRAADAEEMIHNMSRFYRQSLTGDPTNDVALEDEFALQQLYLAIEQVRFPRRLRTRVDLPPDLRGARVPGMILQPLVENSVKYAVAPSSAPVTLAISARAQEDTLILTVADDAPPSGSCGDHGLGIGLANVRDRLAARFNGRADLVTGPAEGGYRTELRLPMEKA